MGISVVVEISHLKRLGLCQKTNRRRMKRNTMCGQRVSYSKRLGHSNPFRPIHYLLEGRSDDENSNPFEVMFF